MPVRRAAAHPGDVLLAEKALADERGDRQPVRIPPVLEAAGGGTAGLVRGANHVACGVQVACQRLLTQHGLAGIQRRQRHVAVHHRRGRHGNHVEIVARDERLPVGGRVGDAELARDTFQSLGRAGAQRHRLEAVRRAEAGDLDMAPQPTPMMPTLNLMCSPPFVHPFPLVTPMLDNCRVQGEGVGRIGRYCPYPDIA